jgi:hypothetical protein
MGYIENPKSAGSGIVCCIPQTGRCPNNCEDCFFQSGRSYLEPLDSNLPNVPLVEYTEGRIVRVNDGNDSNVNRSFVEAVGCVYDKRFFNTSIPKDLDKFPGPVVLTLNPGKITDTGWHKVDPIPKNLMFVRFRVNSWNLKICDEAVEYYSSREVPVVLTFMAYFNAVESIQGIFKRDYVFRKRTLNSYWAITTRAWRRIMGIYQDNKWVYSCGKIEGEKGDTHCRFCGNCLREYFATMERLRAK